MSIYYSLCLLQGSVVPTGFTRVHMTLCVRSQCFHCSNPFERFTPVFSCPGTLNDLQQTTVLSPSLPCLHRASKRQLTCTAHVYLGLNQFKFELFTPMQWVPLADSQRLHKSISSINGEPCGGVDLDWIPYHELMMRPGSSRNLLARRRGGRCEQSAIWYTARFLLRFLHAQWFDRKRKRAGGDGAKDNLPTVVHAHRPRAP